MHPSAPSARSLALSAAAGLGLSLLSGLPASAHNVAGGGLLTGFAHPLLGLDHLLLLLGVGASASFLSAELLLFALAGGILGSMVGLAGGLLPQADLLAALSVSVLGLLLVGVARSGRAPSLPWCGALVMATVAVHGVLHGHEASGTFSWWIGALLGSSLVVALSFLVLRRLAIGWTVRLGVLLVLAGGALALAVPVLGG